MADILKKVVIKAEDLPAVRSQDQYYIVRYRLTSEDRNTISHWSPQYFIYFSLPTRGVGETNGTIVVNQNGNVINAVWQLNEDIITKNVDVFVRWDGGPWNFVTTTSINNASIIIEGTPTTADVAIQAWAYPREYADNLAILSSSISIS